MRTKRETRHGKTILRESHDEAVSGTHQSRGFVYGMLLGDMG